MAAAASAEVALDPPTELPLPDTVAMGPQAAGVADASPPDLRFRNGVVIGTGAALVAAYGFTNWWDDGFSGGFKTESEGWFGQDTEYGGVDKLGHMYANYVGVRLLTPLFVAVGNDYRSATRLAAISTAVTFTVVEVVDGFSTRFKFGGEDFVANLAGMLGGYLLETHPRLDAILDFRLDYRKDEYSEKWDPFGDYEGQRYLLVAKADGFEPLSRSRLTRYLELAVGYGATGYETPPGVDVEGKRTMYVGLSLNLSRLLADTLYDGRRRSTRTQRAADVAFEVLQLPTIIYAENDLD